MKGPIMAKKRYYSDMDSYSSDMIKSQNSATANLPQEVVYKAWPKTSFVNNEALNDTVSGIDSQIDADVREVKKQKPSSKY